MQTSYKLKSILFPWICWIIASAVYAIQHGMYLYPSLVTKELQETFSIGTFEIGLFSSAYLYSYVIMQTPSGLLFDKFSSKKILGIAILLLIFSCVILASTKNYYMALLSRIILGIGGSFTFFGAFFFLLFLGSHYSLFFCIYSPYFLLKIIHRLKKQKIFPSGMIFTIVFSTEQCGCWGCLLGVRSRILR